MGNEPSKDPLNRPFKQRNGSDFWSCFKHKSKPKCRPCSCALYQQTKHCCKQICLTKENQSAYSSLTKVWIFTDEHLEKLRNVLIDLRLQDMTTIIEEFLSGINSTLEEYNVFCHGLSVKWNKPCIVWLKTKQHRMIHLQILGDKGSGKTSLALKCAKNVFKNDYNNYNDDQPHRMYSVQVVLHNISIKMGLMDGALSNGIEYQNTSTESIYVFCIDPSSNNAHDGRKSMEQQVFRILSSSDNISKEHDHIKCAFIVAATKCDWKNQKYIERSEMVIKSCKNSNIPYIEVSAKEGINIDLFLKTCLYELWVQSQTRCCL